MRRVFLPALLALLLSPVAFAQEDEWKGKTDDGWRACVAGKYDEAERLLKDAVNVARNSGPERRQALSLAYLALTQQRRGKSKEADENGRAAHVIFSQSKDSLNQETVRGVHALAELRQAQKKFADADKLYQTALALAQNEKVYGPEHAVVGQILCNMASSLDAQKKYAQAEEKYQEALPLLEAAKLEGESILPRCYEAWAQHYRLQGDYTKAAAKLGKALEASKKTLGAEHPNTGRLQHELGLLYFRENKFDDAVANFQAALALKEKAGDDPAGQAQVLHNLAVALAEQKKYGEAQDALNKALELRRKEKNGQTILAASTLHALGNLALQQGQFDDAEKYYKDALAVKEKVLGAKDAALASDLDSLALLAKKRKDWSEAEKQFKRALELRQKGLGADNRAVASSLHNLANLYRDEGKDAEAEKAYKDALALRTKTLGDDHPLLVPILENYAAFLKKAKRAGDAKELDARVKKIKAQAAVQ